MNYFDITSNREPLQVGEVGVLQHLNRQTLNGLIAEVTGELKRRFLYSLSNPADSEVCLAYKILVPGYPADKRIEWCVKAHQLRRINGERNLDETMKTEPICLLISTE
ncbi:MAG TPA: hypothetical protein VLN56_04340 [Gammaproteobacteria bacterium]|nr:hypothetical protein [Gammaproteobacteria bacterium]